MNSIPIKNIYYFILYAFGAVKNKNILSEKDLEDSSSFNYVITKLFVHEVEKLIRYGIYHDYSLIEEETIFVKGKFNVKESLLKTNEKIVCIFDEFNSNHECNKIIKYTLNRLLFENTLDDSLKKKIRRNYFYFESIPLEGFSLNDVKKIHLNRLNKHYEIALKYALFLNYELIPKDSKGRFDFIHIFKDDQTMSKIYEQFLFNFYDVNLDSSYNVKSGSRFHWQLYKVDDEQPNLPIMETDIEIRKDNFLVVIDAKFYTQVFENRYNVERFRSPHLYQMHAYLSHYEKEYKNLRGILLYPSNGYNFHEVYRKDNSYLLEFATVDLSKDWAAIEDELLNIIEGANTYDKYLE